MAYRDLETIISASQGGVDYSQIFINQGFMYRPAQTDDPEGVLAADAKSYRLEQGKVLSANLRVALTNNTKNVTDVFTILDNGLTQPLRLTIGRTLKDPEPAIIEIENIKKVGTVEKPMSGAMEVTFEGDITITYLD